MDAWPGGGVMGDHTETDRPGPVTAGGTDPGEQLPKPSEKATPTPGTVGVAVDPCKGDGLSSAQGGDSSASRPNGGEPRTLLDHAIEHGWFLIWREDWR